VCVIGGSGSGKTTLARILVGLDAPTAGQSLLDGVDLASLSGLDRFAARRRFAMVVQRAALLDSMTVFDNAAFPLREETDFDEDEIHRRVLAQLGELDLLDAAGQLPGELSGGMAKRVGIARRW
jgi:phospholipid/cholesterol/gamma-HCH transport system ATP-binding protein